MAKALTLGRSVPLLCAAALLLTLVPLGAAEAANSAGQSPPPRIVMRRGELGIWLLYAMSIFALLFPHLAAGDVQDPGPLRLMALAIFLLFTFCLADHYLFGSAVIRSIERL
jgi:hypothetical protein